MTDTSRVLIKQGAEAKIYKTTFNGQPTIIKKRFSKKYRHPTLDEKLTKRRTLQEVRALLKCRKAGILTPLVYFVNHETHEIFMQDIVDGRTLKDVINELLKVPTDDNKHTLQKIAADIGKIISQMHSVDILHGDLTTSNILVTDHNSSTSGGNSSELDLSSSASAMDTATAASRSCNNTAGYIMGPINPTYHVIDFGLSTTVSDDLEGRGVDLYVLERAFLSTHPDTEWLFQVITDTYITSSRNKKEAKTAIAKFEEVRMRGRKRDMTG